MGVLTCWQRKELINLSVKFSMTPVLHFLCNAIFRTHWDSPRLDQWVVYTKEAEIWLSEVSVCVMSFPVVVFVLLEHHH